VMALVYPSIVMVMGIGILIFAMLFIVPKFETVFASLKASLPMSTRILIGTSRAIARYGIFMLMGIVFLAVMANRWVKTVQGREWWHRCHLKAPLLKGVVAASTYATFARTLETLIANGVPLLRALGIVEKTVGNVIIRNEVRRARDRVTDGTSISGPLAAGKVFPPMMIDMLSVGEQTGNVAGALSHIARRYENELERNLRIFTTALEPILIIVVALLVGFVAISILTAVFSLTNAMGV
jgi:type II secretory pathway component PulF